MFLLSGQEAVAVLQSHSAEKKNVSVACFFQFLFFFVCAALLRPCSVVTDWDFALAAVRTEERKDGNVTYRGRHRRLDRAESEKLALIVLASHSQPPHTLPGRPGTPDAISRMRSAFKVLLRNPVEGTSRHKK